MHVTKKAGSACLFCLCSALQAFDFQAIIFLNAALFPPLMEVIRKNHRDFR
jgi:hypothetical protein